MFPIWNAVTFSNYGCFYGRLSTLPWHWWTKGTQQCKDWFCFYIFIIIMMVSCWLSYMKHGYAHGKEMQDTEAVPWKMWDKDRIVSLLNTHKKWLHICYIHRLVHTSKITVYSKVVMLACTHFHCGVGSLQRQKKSVSNVRPDSWTK